MARARTRTTIPSYLLFRDEYLKLAQSVGGPDPFPYGVRDNEPMLATALRYSLNQGLITQNCSVDDLFPESVRSLP